MAEPSSRPALTRRAGGDRGDRGATSSAVSRTSPVCSIGPPLSRAPHGSKLGADAHTGRAPGRSRTLGKALARLSHQGDGLREDDPDRVADLDGLLVASAGQVRRLIAATVMSTASLIALSAQATRWAPCI